MRRDHYQLDSPPLGRRIHLWVYGHFGQPIVVFPSAAGFAHEWEAQGMVASLAPLLDGGRIKLYCPESNVSEAWTRQDADPAWRIQRHLAYERFVLETLVPAVRADCRSETLPLATAGCSFGGFYAANFALKQPETFRWAHSSMPSRSSHALARVRASHRERPLASPRKASWSSTRIFG